MLYPLRASTVTANGQDTIPLSSLPKAWLGRIPHVRRFIFELAYTPTHTTAPTTYGNNAVVKQCDFNDGTIFRFQGGFNHLRARERMSATHARVADAQTNTASGSVRYVTRVMYFSPAQSIAADSDFLIPTGMLENGEIRLTYGALTDVSADTTNFTGQLKIWADIVLLDEIRIPPAVQ